MRNHLKQSSAPECLQLCRPDWDIFGDWIQISAPVFLMSVPSVDVKQWRTVGLIRDKR